MPKILVSFYSRTGNTKKLAKKISQSLDADLDEIVDKKKRSGFFDILGSLKDEMFENKTKIQNKKDPSRYDLVVLGTPVWVGKITPAVRTYLSENNFKKIAFFCTSNHGPDKTFRVMTNLSKSPVEKLSIKKCNIDNSQDKIKKFSKKIKKSI